MCRYEKNKYSDKIIKYIRRNINLIVIIAFIIMSNIFTYHMTCKYTNKIILDNIKQSVIVIDNQYKKPISKPPTVKVNKQKIYTFNTKKGKIKMTKEQYEKALEKYIDTFIPQNIKNSDSYYTNKLCKEYIKLTDNFSDDKNFVLYYIALCSVESNFNNKAKSSAGAIGIPQVMWGIWKNIAKDNWGIDKSDYVHDIYSQIYVGYKIYEIQYKKYKGNMLKAHNAYSGGHSGYHNKIEKRYASLINTMKEVSNIY